MITVATKCPFCRTETPLTVSERGYRRWVSGELIQRAFPELSPDDRERLQTGICPKCYPS